MKKKALITGITGQDGSYLAELLLDRGYEVHGLVRRMAAEDPKHRFWRINHILNDIHLHDGSLESYGSILNAVEEVKPAHCYHLAAQSYVATSFSEPFSTIKTNIDGTLHVLEAIRRKAPECKLYFAASSEMFGKVRETPQTESTPFHPRSPYGVSKVTGFELVRNYREAYNLFACCGILFNHESPRRGMEFVTRKITSTAAKIKLGKETELRLGNLDARRDWGFAGEYVYAMSLMLTQSEPRDYVIATGVCHSVKDFVRLAFKYFDLNWKDYVVEDPEFYRPAEVYELRGDASLAEEKLNWKAMSTIGGLVARMAQSDYDRERK